MIVYEIWINTQEETRFQFPTFEEAKHYGLNHFTEFYIQPKFIVTDQDYFERSKNHVGNGK